MRFPFGSLSLRRKFMICASIGFLAIGAVQADVILNTFTAGSVIKASEVNANFANLKAGIANPQLANSAVTADATSAGTLRFNDGRTEVATATAWTPLVQGDRPYGEFFLPGFQHPGGSPYSIHLVPRFTNSGLSLPFPNQINIANPGDYRVSYKLSYQTTPNATLITYLVVNGGTYIGSEQYTTSSSVDGGNCAASGTALVRTTSPNNTLTLRVYFSDSIIYSINNPSVTIERLN